MTTRKTDGMRCRYQGLLPAKPESHLLHSCPHRRQAGRQRAKGPLCKGRDALRKHAGGMFLAKAGRNAMLATWAAGWRGASRA